MGRQFFMSAEFDTETSETSGGVRVPCPRFPHRHATTVYEKDGDITLSSHFRNNETEKLEKERKRHERQRAGRPGSGSFTSCHGVLS